MVSETNAFFLLIATKTLLAKTQRKYYYQKFNESTHNQSTRRKHTTKRSKHTHTHVDVLCPLKRKYYGPVAGQAGPREPEAGEQKHPDDHEGDA